MKHNAPQIPKPNPIQPPRSKSDSVKSMVFGKQMLKVHKIQNVFPL